MSLYVPLDVEYFHDPKIIDAGPMAELLYIRSLCFAKRAESDGHIAANQLQAISNGLYKRTQLASKLVEVGAWTEVPTGWVITGWLKRNKSKAQLAHAKEAARLKSLQGNHKQWHTDRDIVDPTCELCNPHRDPHGDRHGAPREEKGSEARVKGEGSEESSSLASTQTELSTGRDDDDFARTITLIVEARSKGRHIDNPRAYATRARTNTITEDGELVQRMLRDGDTPETVAAFVLGYGFTAQAEKTAGVPWCDQSCTDCDGTGWVWVDDNLGGYEACPGRMTA